MGLSGSRLQGQLWGFVFLFFALHLVYTLEVWKHPVLDVSHGSTWVIRGQRWITGLLVHTWRSLLCPYKRWFPRKWRIGKAPWLFFFFFFKIKPKSKHLEKKFEIHSKVLKTRGRLWSYLWTGLICNPRTNNPILQLSGLLLQRPQILLMCIWLFNRWNLPLEKARPASTVQIS